MIVAVGQAGLIPWWLRFRVWAVGEAEGARVAMVPQS